MTDDEYRMNDPPSRGYGAAGQTRMTRRTSQSRLGHLSIRASFVIRHSSFVIHNHSFKSTTPLDATMLYLSFMFSRGRRSTVPPAFSTRSQPAAMSHKLIPVSMYASNRPQATYAMSSAALPSTRHLRTRWI